MNARNLFTTLFAAALLGASTAQAWAAVGTAKARGDYRPGAYKVQRDSGNRTTYARRAPVYRSTTAPVVASPTPMVAQAPAEGRRFSYAPATNDAVAGTPCPSTATVPQDGRRYSYAPAEASASPTVSAPRVYGGGSGYSRSRSSSGPKGLWALPKTDPRKFNSR